MCQKLNYSQKNYVKSYNDISKSFKIIKAAKCTTHITTKCICCSDLKFWLEKDRRNKERDAVNIQMLESLSWSVVTIWECELKSKVLQDTIAKIEGELAANKAKWEAYQARRRSEREFARAESRRKRQILKEVERELQEQFHIPIKIRRLASSDNDS